MPFGDVSLSPGASRIDPPAETYGLGRMILDSLTVPILPDSILEGLRNGPRPELAVTAANFALFAAIAYALAAYDIAASGAAGGALLFGLAPIALGAAAAVAVAGGACLYPLFLFAGGQGPANRVMLLISLSAPLGVLQIMLNGVPYLWAAPALVAGWIWIRGAAILFEAPVGRALAVFGLLTLLGTGGQWLVRVQVERARTAYRQFKSRGSPVISTARSLETFLDGFLRMKGLPGLPAGEARTPGGEDPKLESLRELQDQLSRLARDPEARLPGAAPESTVPPEVQRELDKFRDRVTALINDPEIRPPGRPPPFMAPPGVDRILKNMMKKVEDAINAPEGQQEKKVEEAIKSLIDYGDTTSVVSPMTPRETSPGEAPGEEGK